MTRVIEVLMYLLFILAFVPWALLEAWTLGYYLLHPEMVEVRDAALEAQAAAITVSISLYLLVPAALSLLWVLIMAPRAGKICAAVLLAAFGCFLYGSSRASQFGFNTWGRLWLEAIPVMVFVLLTIVLMVWRLMKA